MIAVAAWAWSVAVSPPKRAMTAPSPPPQRTSMLICSRGECVSALAARASCPASSVPAAAVAVAGGNGCSRTDSSRIAPSVPNEPAKSLARSYPATFLITLPPLLATVPSDSATRMPTTRSRTPP